MFKFIATFCVVKGYDFKPSYKGFIGISGIGLKRALRELNEFAMDYYEGRISLTRLKEFIETAKEDRLYSKERIVYFPVLEVY